MVTSGKMPKVILVRLETSPEDIVGMQVSQGILTARGGMTSHAAVVARGMGTCCEGRGSLLLQGNQLQECRSALRMEQCRVPYGKYVRYPLPARCPYPCKVRLLPARQRNPVP